MGEETHFHSHQEGLNGFLSEGQLSKTNFDTVTFSSSRPSFSLPVPCVAFAVPFASVYTFPLPSLKAFFPFALIQTDAPPPLGKTLMMSLLGALGERNILLNRRDRVMEMKERVRGEEKRAIGVGGSADSIMRAGDPVAGSEGGVNESREREKEGMWVC